MASRYISLQEFPEISQKQVSISGLPELDQHLPEGLNPELFHVEVTANLTFIACNLQHFPVKGCPSRFPRPHSVGQCTTPFIAHHKSPAFTSPQLGTPA